MDAAGLIGQRLRALREGEGLTQQQVATTSGIKRPNVSRAEGGTVLQSIDTVVRLSLAIGVQPSAVFAVLDEVGE